LVVNNIHERYFMIWITAKLDCWMQSTTQCCIKSCASM